jgi:putative SOS response-associated peptidase YedK
MCGRYTLAVPSDELVEVFDVPEPTFALAPRFNVAPGQDAPVVGEDRRGRRMGLLRWGFVPARAAGAARAFVNARGESVARTPSFREAFAHRRCLVPADGFYEWREDGGRKVPYWFHPVDGRVLSFAGIWEHWERHGEEPRDGFAILTIAANDDVRPVHERMPLIVAPADRAAWLARDTEPAVLGQILARPAPGSLAARRVSTRVNSARDDDADLLREV